MIREMLAKAKRVTVKKGGSQDRGSCRRRERDVGGIVGVAIFNTGRHCPLTGGARHIRFGQPSKVGNGRRNVAACGARMFLAEGRVCGEGG